MPTKLERLLFAQSGKCFFCHQHLPRKDASIEHLVAVSNGGDNREHNCVVCCKSLNEHFGSMSLKDKLKVILQQRGTFSCPRGGANTIARAPSVATAPSLPSASPDLDARIRLLIFNLRSRGVARPRTIKALSSTINALFQKSLSNEQITAIIGMMQKQRYIALNGTKVAYSLPASEPGM